MTITDIIGIVLIVVALFLIVSILLQSGKDKSLSGTIAGGNSSSDTYYGKNKGKASDRILSKVTAITAVIFAALVLVCFIIQPSSDKANDVLSNDSTTPAANTTTVADGTTVSSETTVPDDSDVTEPSSDSVAEETEGSETTVAESDAE